jgi:hypothetical protein
MNAGIALFVSGARLLMGEGGQFPGEGTLAIAMPLQVKFSSASELEKK